MDPDCYWLALRFYSGFVADGDVTTGAAQTAAPAKQSSAGERTSMSMMLTAALTKETVASHKETAGETNETAAPTNTSTTTKEAAPHQPQRQHDAAKLPSWRESLAYLSLLVPAYAYAQSFVGGDLSTQAPYGLPAQDFAVAISNPASDATFSITGYNTSLAAGSVKATENTIDGWSLNIGVTANVPLTNSFNNAINKDLCIDATTLSITPPAGVAHFNSTSWRVCAVVFTGGLKAGGSTRSDGSCSAALPDECIRQLQANSGAGKAGRNGGCRDLDIPGPCAGHFNGNAGTGFEITPIGNNSALADRRSMFFAAGFEPAQKGNKSALAAAQRHVWPVLLAWTHFTESGDVHDSAGSLSCAKSTDSKEVVSVGWDLDPKAVRWYYWVWAAFVGWVLLRAVAMVLPWYCPDLFTVW